MNRSKKIDRSKIKDEFAFMISVTYIDNAIGSGLISQAEFLRLVKGIKKA